MDVKEAARTAKDYLTDLFADESITNVGLEEIEFDEFDNVWKITVGSSRPWDQRNALVAIMGSDGRPIRSYKVVRINDDDGMVMSLTDRIPEAYK